MSDLIKRIESMLNAIDSDRSYDEMEGTAISVIGKVLEPLSIASRRQVIAHFQARYNASYITFTIEAMREASKLLRLIENETQNKEEA
jgi:hypothetical protein